MENNTASEIATETLTLHKFERAGLGKAPFRVIGWSVEKYQACPGAPIQPAGSCDYCGQGIMLQFRVKGIDGKVFKVGQDCVAQTGDRGLTKTVAKVVKERAAQRNADKVASLTSLLADESIRAKLTAMDHPTLRGLSMMNYANWMMTKAGTTGKLKALRVITKALG